MHDSARSPSRARHRARLSATAEELTRLARLLAGGQLPGGRADLPARQPPAARALARRAHQAAAPRATGGRARGSISSTRTSTASSTGATPTSCTSAGPATGARPWWPTPGWRGPTASCTPTCRETPGAWPGCSGSSRSPGGSRATPLPRPRARSTRGVSSGTGSPMPTGRPSTTPTWSWPASWATARPRRARLATSWHANKFLDPVARRCGAPDPAPQRLQDRQPHGAGPDPRGRAVGAVHRVRLPPASWWRGASTARTPCSCTSGWPSPSTPPSTRSPASGPRPAPGAVRARPAWPMIILRTPKGWTGPKFVDGVPVEGTWRAHQVPLGEVRTNPAHLAQLEEWMRSYRPEELFDEDGRPVPAIAGLAPVGERRMSATPHANGGRAAARPRAPRLDGVRGGGDRARDHPARGDAGCSARSCGT